MMMTLTRKLLLFVALRLAVCLAEKDVNSGCPSWGCMSQGSFALSSGVPLTNGTVSWSTIIAHETGEPDIFGARGCVSDQVSVVCVTPSGYVSLDPATGKQFWNYSAMTTPFLPVMDIYGDVIGLDANHLVAVDQTGKAQHPIDISVLQPSFSLMLANNSILLLTSSRQETGQIVTYGTDGVVDGAIPLRGIVERVNGTFMVTGHPIIVGFRAYVLTQFVPDNSSSPEAQTVLGMHRLYALDLWAHMTMRIRTAWYFNFEREGYPRSSPLRTAKGGKLNGLPPVVAFSGTTVYVNIPSWSDDVEGKQPMPGTLWAIQDGKEGPSLVFRQSATYGQIVHYDTFDNPIDENTKTEVNHVLWVLTRSPPMIQGFSAKNGSFVMEINVYEIANVTTITSDLAITRQPKSPINDVLVFGAMEAGSGDACLVAIEQDMSGKSRLLWKTKLSEKGPKDQGTSVVAGQITNVALPVPTSKGVGDGWKRGIVASVLEMGNGYQRLHVKGVF